MMRSEICIADALYDIADAEFAADYQVHDLWKALSSTHREFRKLFARDLRRRVSNISVREQMAASWHLCDVVAQRIAEDWWQEREQQKWLDTVRR